MRARLAWMLLCVAPLSAGEGESSYASDFFHMLLVLFFVILILFVVVKLLKKLMSTRLRQINEGSRIKIIERRSLNPKASLYLVEIDGRPLCVGESPQGVHLVADLSSSESREEK